MIAAALRHLRFAIRSITRQPAQAAVVVIALGLGIGLTVTMYSVVHGIFLRGLPFKDPERLLQLDCANAAAGIERLPVSARDYFSWREEQTAFEDIGAWYGIGITVSGRGGPAERFNGAHLSSNLLRLLQVEPALGRSFGATDDTTPPREIVISHTVWRDRYGGDLAILGKSIRVNGEMMTVIGVMPAGFGFPLSQDFWLPLGLDPTNAERRVGLQVVGRLAEGSSLERAQAEFGVLAARLAAAYPDTNRDVGVVVRRYVDAYSDPEMRSYLNRMLAVVLGVFLVACANVANLLLARSTIRAREVAIRKALGVTQLGLAAQFLAESLLLATAGGALGLLLAQFASVSIQRIVKPVLRSFWVDIRIDLPVVLFAVALTCLAALLAGLVPVLRTSGPSLRQILNEETAGAASLRSNRIGRALVVVQIAIACALVVPMGLMIKSVVRLHTADYGFTTDDLLLAHVSLAADGYPDPQGWSRFFGELQRRLAATPQVASVALASSLPDERPLLTSFAVEGARYLSPAAVPKANWVAVTPEYFATLDLTIIEGRGFRDTDDAGAQPVVILGRSLAERHFGRGSAIGRQLRIGAPDADVPWKTIVGVAEDPFRSGLPPRARGLLPAIRGESQDPVADVVYVPRAQEPSRAASIALRTHGDPLSLAPRVRQEVAALNPNVPALFVRSMADGLAEATWDFRLFTFMFTAFGFAALFLAMTGLYATMALTVSRRKREFGVRRALGASGRDNLRLALMQGLSQVALALALGLLLAAVVARLLAALLLGVDPWDLSVFGAVAAAFLATGLVACLLPAWRAARVHPLSAMRDA